jgi:GTPase SAR1 family protein
LVISLIDKSFLHESRLWNEEMKSAVSAKAIIVHCGKICDLIDERKVEHSVAEKLATELGGMDHEVPAESRERVVELFLRAAEEAFGFFIGAMLVPASGLCPAFESSAATTDAAGTYRTTHRRRLGGALPKSSGDRYAGDITHG